MDRTSKIILVKNIKMDREYVNVLSYSEQQMIDLCMENKVAMAENYQFIRSNGSIKTSFSYSQCLQSNYIAFQNPDYDNKWFFAWIDEVIYKGNLNTEIRYTIDAWSTWFDYWQKKVCFISRQHVNDDTIGLHTLDENLDIGDVVCDEETIEEAFTNEYGFWVAMETAWIIDNNSHDTSSETKNGKQFSGCTMYDMNIWGNIIILFHINDAQDLDNLSYYIYRTAKDGHIEDIKNLFIVADAFVNQATLIENVAFVEDNEFTFFRIPKNYSYKTFNEEIQKPTQFDSYVPKNNKLFCYPYSYLLVTNNNGNQNIFKYEDFYNQSSCKFKNDLALSIGLSCRLTPLNHKRISENVDESIPLGKYPTCSWSADSFTNWLTLNAVNMPTRIVTSALGTSLSLLGIGSQIGTKDSNGGQIGMSFASSGMSIANNLANKIGELKLAKLAPNIEGGQNTGDINWASGKNTFVYKKMRAKIENLKIIDDYFSRFGYKINKLELPNITGRRNWNYIEIGSSEEIGYGQVQSTFMQIINNACRKGVTIWHNHTNLGNYSVDNSII